MFLIWRMCRGQLSPLGQLFNIVILSRKRWCPYTYTAGLTCCHWCRCDGEQEDRRFILPQAPFLCFCGTQHLSLSCLNTNTAVLTQCYSGYTAVRRFAKPQLVRLLQLFLQGRTTMSSGRMRHCFSIYWNSKTSTLQASTLGPPCSAEGRRHLHLGKCLLCSVTNKPQVCHTVGLLCFSCWTSSHGETFKPRTFSARLPDWISTLTPTL